MKIFFWNLLIVQRNTILEKDYKKRFDIYQVNQFLENELNINHKNNIIIGEIYIKKENANEDIRIINSFEETKRYGLYYDFDDDVKFKNEKEIKENISIKINGKNIEFTYYYKFNKEGKYIIEYSFKNNLTKACYLFCDCKYLRNLDLSSFNTQNITNMIWMFLDCYYLTNLNLSNFNTQNVNNMRFMFHGCESLTNLDLSNFDTQKVEDMKLMFDDCKSLTNYQILILKMLKICAVCLVVVLH